ncbi:hypothetical protein SAMN04488579_11378 [Eubacterium barkeri]|uniref:Uncharacterized protein n=1 Tax=Eubacterium barkeri TaxID=1528 RepID=A0A1H3GFM3_EUBBA|nr:hypothetical protein SAMN04488579_11378 [Eubacterium barkeri]
MLSLVLFPEGGYTQVSQPNGLVILSILWRNEKLSKKMEEKYLNVLKKYGMSINIVVIKRKIMNEKNI